jgi:hypothetical protein
VSLRSRLLKLEKTTTIRPTRSHLLTDSEWLAVFEAAQDEAIARGEVDYPAALQIYRDAVARRDDREAWFWIAEIYSRVLARKPPVTEAEYHRLVGWYRRHQAELLDDTLKLNLYLYGSRECFATVTVEKLRKMEAAHPELVDLPILNSPTSNRRHLLRRERTVVTRREPRDLVPGQTSQAVSGPLASRPRNCKNIHK